ncbi:MAG: cbb3-type cytochrome oxidase assembly protein CcoS [Candidatus Bostrichicola ureolyticus]|nr:MAG: cbb3-type cytochrome oxidase assembly protein CcoS [Candidatus Bostrichicola ureolyticus]
MDVLLLMIPSSIFLGILFLIMFIISVYTGQFDDIDSQAVRILLDDKED